MKKKIKQSENKMLRKRQSQPHVLSLSTQLHIYYLSIFINKKSNTVDNIDSTQRSCGAVIIVERLTLV